MRRLSMTLALGLILGCNSTPSTYEQYRNLASEPIDRVSDAGPTGGRVPIPHLDDAPLFEGHGELLLVDYLAEVLRRNPSLDAARSAWQAALARFPQVTELDDPMLGYGLAPGSIRSDDVDLAQLIELSQRLPWPGKLELRGEMALAEADARRADFRTDRDRLLNAAKTAYFEHYYVYRAIEVNEVNKAILAEFRGIAEAKYGAGTASVQDALQAEVAFDHLLHRGIVLERTRRVARGRLNTLLNRSPAAVLPAPPATLELPRPRPRYEDLLARAQSTRPELAALAHRHSAELLVAVDGCVGARSWPAAAVLRTPPRARPVA